MRLSISPPAGQTIPLAPLVKGVLDGVICAFQAHTDLTTINDVADRITAHLPTQPSELQALLLDSSNAVLGTVPRLLHPRGAGVAWSPADDQCLAAELLAAPLHGPTWAFRGDIHEIARH